MINVGELESRQIVAFANEGMAAEGIAMALGIDVGVVKLVLGRNNAGTESDRDITDEDLKNIRRNLTLLALGAQDEAVQAKVGMFLLERDRPKAKEPMGVSNVTLIQNAIFSARERFEKMREEYNGQPHEQVSCVSESASEHSERSGGMNQDSNGHCDGRLITAGGG